MAEGELRVELQVEIVPDLTLSWEKKGAMMLSRVEFPAKVTSKASCYFPRPVSRSSMNLEVLYSAYRAYPRATASEVRTAIICEITMSMSFQLLEGTECQGSDIRPLW